MEKKIRVFDGGSVRVVLKKLLKAGYRPATLEETWKLREEKKIPFKWYDTGTMFFRGKIRKATMSELDGIDYFYDRGGRLVFLGDLDNLGLDGDNSLLNLGRFVGVATESHKKRKN